MLTSDAITENTAGEGGGIYNQAGTITANDLTVSDNSSSGDTGGIDNVGGHLTLTDSAVSGNTAYSLGGGISSAPPAGSFVTVTVPAVTYRYIRYLGGTQWVNIAELEVDGG